MSKLYEWGNAIGLRIPKIVLVTLGWASGTIVKVTANEDGTALIERAPDNYKDERFTMTDKIAIRLDRKKPYVTVLKRFEAQWVVAHNNLKAMEKRIEDEDDRQLVLEMIKSLEGERYQRLNQVIDNMDHTIAKEAS